MFIAKICALEKMFNCKAEISIICYCLVSLLALVLIGSLYLISL